MKSCCYHRKESSYRAFILIHLGLIGLAMPVRSPAADVLVSTNTDAALRDAISNANPGDTIVFAPGLSGQTITLSGGQLTIDKDLSIDASNLTGGLTISGDNLSRIFVVESMVTASIDSLTITEGKAPDGMTAGATGENGGGILNQGDLTLTNVTVSGNSAGDGADEMTTGGSGGFGGNGGGIYNEGAGATVRLNNSEILGNFAGEGGDGSTAGNGGNGGSGGGIYNNEGIVRITNTTILTNAAGDGGSAEDQNGDGGHGGGIASSGFITLYQSSVSFNVAGDRGQAGFLEGSDGNGGGIAILENGSIVIRGSSIRANSAESGGGIDCLLGSVLIENSTISGNSAKLEGGGIQFSGTSLRVDLCTVTENTSTYDGGGLFLGEGNIFLVNSIVAGNDSTTDATGEDICMHFEYATPTLNPRGNNLVGDNDTVETEFPAPGLPGTANANGDLVGTTVNPLDPQLVEETASVITALGSIVMTFFSPLSDSPVIDAGDNTQITPDAQDLDGDMDNSEDTPYDQRGENRVSGAAVDLGAVEDQAARVVDAAATDVSAALSASLKKKIRKLKSKIKKVKRSGKKAKLKKLKKKLKKLNKKLKQL